MRPRDASDYKRGWDSAYRTTFDRYLVLLALALHTERTNILFPPPLDPMWWLHASRFINASIWQKFISVVLVAS